MVMLTILARPNIVDKEPTLMAATPTTQPEYPATPHRTLQAHRSRPTARHPATDGEVSAPRQRRFRTWHFPTPACVMVETRLTEGMLLGRSAGLYCSHQRRCTWGYEQRCNSNSRSEE